MARVPIVKGFGTGRKIGPSVGTPFRNLTARQIWTTPFSKLPGWYKGPGLLGAILLGGRAGSFVGKQLNKRLGLDNKLANAAYKHLGPAPRGLINFVDKVARLKGKVGAHFGGASLMDIARAHPSVRLMSPAIFRHLKHQVAPRTPAPRTRGR